MNSKNIFLSSTNQIGTTLIHVEANYIVCMKLPMSIPKFILVGYFHFKKAKLNK